MTRRGRPPGRALPSLIVARITAELREAIELEAKRSGRTLSAVAHDWLARGRLAAEVAEVLYARRRDAE